MATGRASPDGEAGDRVARLIGDLDSRLPWKRAGAIRELGRAGDPRAVEPLVGILGSGSLGVVVRAMAADALSLLAGEDALEALLGATGALSLRVRAAALAGLGAFPEPRATEALVDALHSVFSRYAAQTALVRHGTCAIAPVLPLLVDPDPAVSRVAGCVLESLGERAIATAFRRLFAGDIGAIAVCHDPRVFPLLGAALHGPAWDLRRAAVRAFVAIGAPSVPHLWALVETPASPRPQPPMDALAVGACMGAAEALGCLAAARDVGRLRDLLAGADPLNRVAGAVGLAHAGDPCGLGLLTAALSDERDPLREAASRALGRLEARAAGALPGLQSAWRREDGPAARAAMSDAVFRIQRALRRAPTELVASHAPEGTGTEPEAETPGVSGARDGG